MKSATDSSGGVASDELSPADINNYKKTGAKLSSYIKGSKITNDDFISSDVDVLILAALGDAITEDNADKVKAKIILELANGPVNEKAYKILTDRGVIVVPDILANAGGVTVSYFERLQNRAGEHWSEEKVNKMLDEYMTKACKDIFTVADKESVSLKEAAFEVAIARILE